MFKVAVVGHSQVPSGLAVENTQVKIYRIPGARAQNFFSEERLSSVFILDL